MNRSLPDSIASTSSLAGWAAIVVACGLAAAFATALVGTSPFFIEYATNARGYAPVGLADLPRPPSASDRRQAAIG